MKGCEACQTILSLVASKSLQDRLPSDLALGNGRIRSASPSESLRGARGGYDGHTVLSGIGEHESVWAGSAVLR